MFKWIKNKNSLKKELFTFKEEPLTKISIILLILLDIFIFTNIQFGIDNEVKKTPKVYSYYPYSCVKHFKELKTSYESYSLNEYKYIDNFINKSDLCVELENKIIVLIENKKFKANYLLNRELKEKLELNNDRLDLISKKYNTRLFEKIANIPNNSNLHKIKNEYDLLTNDNSQILEKLKTIVPIERLDGFKEYKKFVEENKSKFFENKQSYEFWQPFNEYKNILIFILPLFLIFGYIFYKNKKSSLKGEKYNPILKIISAHISFLLFIPLVWYTLCIIYHVIPKTLLKDIIDYLISIGLLSLLNYLSIFIVVIIFAGLIYFIQKRTAKLKAQKVINKDYVKLISSSKCFNCENHINYENSYCPFCGTKLHENCQNCENETIIHEKFCSTCGNQKQE